MKNRISILTLCTYFTIVVMMQSGFAQRIRPSGQVQKRGTPVRSQPQPRNNPGQQGNRTPARQNVNNKGEVKNNANINSGNNTVNVNVDRSRNINVNNQNAVVRQNNFRPYTRPPVVYGGRQYYSYHPYYYHPYHPFYWGPAYHPWGFFVATLATTAILVTVANEHYHYDQGVYYTAANGGYTAVPAPVGAVITTLPGNYQTVVVNETTNNYYYGGTFYEKTAKGYEVVPPTAGAIVEKLPEGGKEVKIGDVTYVKYGETYYQPITQNGKNVYEVVTVK